jgi:hypothetical protein
MMDEVAKMWELSGVLVLLTSIDLDPEFGRYWEKSLE